MGLQTQSQNAYDKIGPSPGLKLRVPAGARILIVCEDNSDTERLKDLLREQGFATEWAKSITAGWGGAQTGRFLGGGAGPPRGGGSWGRGAALSSARGMCSEGGAW